MRAKSVPQGIEAEYIKSKRMVVDDEGTLWISHVTQEDDTESSGFKYLCIASSELHPQDLSLAKTISIKIIPPLDGSLNLQNDAINVESFLMHASPSEVSFKSGRESQLWCIFGGE